MIVFSMTVLPAASRQSNESLAYSAQSVPPALAQAFPSFSNLSSTGNALAVTIMKTAEFTHLSGGLPYHIEPYSSFGYTTGQGIDPSERVILFAPGDSAYIVTNVDLVTKQIQNMEFFNDSTISIINM